ncbi:MAG TPA: hypothetical protein VKR30_08520 [Candidatus Limnocylindrales bacterium]|nr:hypothetical protein [Candidatus Limnocylindrales bacterium]
MPQRRVTGPDRIPETAADPDDPAVSSRPRLDSAGLPLPYMSRRRLAQLAGLAVAAWLLIAFGRTVASASAASDRADALRGQNAALQDVVTSLQGDLARVEDPRFIALQARAAGLGGPGEIPFTLAPGAPTPGPDAPGSAAVRVGAQPDHGSPLDGWLSVLFGRGS